MERSGIALLAATALALGSAALAQPGPDRAAPGVPQSQDVQVSDADLEKFADIYVDLQDTADEYETRLAQAKNESEAQELQSRMQKESVDKVAKRGWTPEHYVTVAQAINADPDLAQKALALIGKQ
jgi:uncharacterized protein DUF4168